MRSSPRDRRLRGVRNDTKVGPTLSLPRPGHPDPCHEGSVLLNRSPESPGEESVGVSTPDRPGVPERGSDRRGPGRRSTKRLCRVPPVAFDVTPLTDVSGGETREPVTSGRRTWYTRRVGPGREYHPGNGGSPRHEDSLGAVRVREDSSNGTKKK